MLSVTTKPPIAVTITIPRLLGSRLLVLLDNVRCNAGYNCSWREVSWEDGAGAVAVTLALPNNELNEQVDSIVTTYCHALGIVVRFDHLGLLKIVSVWGTSPNWPHSVSSQIATLTLTWPPPFRFSPCALKIRRMSFKLWTWWKPLFFPLELLFFRHTGSWVLSDWNR